MTTRFKHNIQDQTKKDAYNLASILFDNGLFVKNHQGFVTKRDHIDIADESHNFLSACELNTQLLVSNHASISDWRNNSRRVGVISKNKILFLPNPSVIVNDESILNYVIKLHRKISNDEVIVNPINRKMFYYFIQDCGVEINSNFDSSGNDFRITLGKSHVSLFKRYEIPFQTPQGCRTLFEFNKISELTLPNLENEPQITARLIRGWLDSIGNIKKLGFRTKLIEDKI